MRSFSGLCAGKTTEMYSNLKEKINGNVYIFTIGQKPYNLDISVITLNYNPQHPGGGVVFIWKMHTYVRTVSTLIYVATKTIGCSFCAKETLAIM